MFGYAFYYYVYSIIYFIKKYFPIGLVVAIIFGLGVLLGMCL